MIAGSVAGCRPAASPEPASAYVPAADGTRLAVDYYVPGGGGPATARTDASVIGVLPPAGRWPTVLRMTTHWRDLDRDAKPGVSGPRTFEATTFNTAGYALVLADARGTGASFGARFGPPGPADAPDVSALLDWIVGQPWSDGRVAVWGEGDDAAFAELAATSGHAAVRAAIVRFGELDLYAQRLHPGGVPDRRLFAALEREARLLDAGDPCAFVLEEPECDRVARVFHGPRPVADDRAALAAAIAEHGDGRARWLAAAAVAAGRDDVLRPAAADVSPGAAEAPDRPATRVGALPWPATIDDASMLGQLDALVRSDVPIQAWAGWLDGGTVDAALERFDARHRHHEVILWPLGERGLVAADPSGGVAGDPAVGVEDQFARMIAFLQSTVPEGAGASRPISGPIEYRIGEERTAVDRWPPRSARAVVWRPRADGSLDRLGARDDHATLTRRLAVEPGGGATARWLARVGSAIEYAGPAPDSDSAAVFTSAPLSESIDVLGSPAVTVTVAIGRPNGVVHAYLEVVPVRGRARLVSDGGLALAHRAVASGTVAGQGAPRHTYRMANRLSAPPEQPVTVAIRLWPVAVRVASGESLRLSLVGGSLDGGPQDASRSATMRVVLDDATVLRLEQTPANAAASAAR